MKKTILIAIPAFNCEVQIQRVLLELLQVRVLFDEHDVYFLVIDNRSADGTVAVSERILKTFPVASRVNVIRHHNNLGLGGSQKQAFLWAWKLGCEFLIILHGDHQATPKEIPTLMVEAENNPDDVAILGSRFSQGSSRVGYSVVRTVGNRALNFVYSLLSFCKVEDLGSGLNLFKVEAFEREKVLGYANGFTFNMDLLLGMIFNDRKFRYCPITWTEWDQVSNARNFKVGWAALKILLQWKMRIRKPQENGLGFGYELVLGQEQ